MTKYAGVDSTNSVLTERDVEMLASGRRLERETLLELMDASAKKNMKNSPEYALAVGFLLETIKALPNA